MAQGAVSYKMTDIHFDLVNFGSQVAVSASISKYIVDDTGNPVTIGSFQGQLQVAAATLGPMTVATVKAQAIAYLQSQYPALQGQVIG
jgi:hypothetical protein